MFEMSVDCGVNSATEAVEDATGGVRMRHPNVTIDQSQVTYEQNRCLKASRSAAKGVITRRRNEVREMMSDFGNPYNIEQKLPELDEAITGFEAAHQAYHNQQYRIAAAAKRASLMAEASMLREQQALQQEELRLQQRKQELALETEIAKAKAEERALAEAEARIPECRAKEGFRNSAPAVKVESCLTKEPREGQELPIRITHHPVAEVNVKESRHRTLRTGNLNIPLQVKRDYVYY